MSIIQPSFIDTDNFSVPSMFECMFNDVSHEILIMPGDSADVSYSTFSSDIHLLWGIQIIDYKFGDKLSVHILNIFMVNLFKMNLFYLKYYKFNNLIY
jgi:hypothetical protein